MNIPTSQLGQLPAVLAPCAGTTVIALLVCEAVIGNGNVQIGPLDAVGATLVVVGSLAVAVRMRMDKSGPVAEDQVEIGFSDMDVDDDEVQFDANPFESRAPQTRRKDGKAHTVVAGRHSAVRLGATGGVAFGLSLGLQRQGSDDMAGEWIGFLAASTVVTLTFLWPVASRLSDPTGKSTSEHKLWHLVALGGTGMLSQFWLTAGSALSTQSAGATHSATMFCAVAAIAILLTRAGIGEPLDAMYLYGAVVILVGVCFAAVAMFVTTS